MKYIVTGAAGLIGSALVWKLNQLGIDDILDGRQKVLAGVYLIQGFWHKYEDAGRALMCYNCGEGGAQNLWKQGVYSTYYSRTILDRAEQLTLREPVA